MKPNFALNLTHDSIGLLHRTSRGWLEVGLAELDASDLGEALGYLRKSALGLSPAGFTTKLVIPASQILYAEVEAPGPTDSKRRGQIRKALQGMTPYDVKDLVFDWSGDGETVKVAVVARETLDEAEQFALQHKFNAVSFVAIPEGTSFDGEPFFGPATGAAQWLPTGEKVERDDAPVSIVASEIPRPAAEPEVDHEPPLVIDSPPVIAETPEPAAEPLPEPVAEQELLPDPAPEGEVEPEASPVDILPEAPVEPAPVQMDTLSDLAAEVVEPEPVAAPDETPSEPLAADPAQPDLPEPDTAEPDQPDTAAPALTVMEDIDPDLVPATDEKDAADAAPVSPPPARSPEPSAEPPTADDDHDAPLALDVEPADGDDSADAGVDTPPPIVPAPTFTSRRQPPPDLGAAPVMKGAAPAAGTTAPLPAGRKTTLPPPPPLPRSLGSVAGKVTAPGIAGLSAERRPKVTAPITDPRNTRRPSPAATPTGLGSRAAPQKGKPRFLGLILTGILLLLLAMVAAWSSYYLASSDDATAAEDVAMVQNVAVEPDGSILPPPGVEDEMLADQQDPADFATNAEVTEPPLPADPPAPAEVLAAADTPLAEPEPDMAAPARPAEPDEVAAVAAPEAAAPDAPAPEAEGTGGQAPIPNSDAQDEIFLSTMDAPPASQPTSALPGPEALPETLPTAQLAAPPFGTEYQFDGQGRIQPTAEGIVTPEGITLFSVRPVKEPPPRPAALQAAAATTADPAATALLPAPEVTQPPEADIAADPALAGSRPRTRPEGLAVPASTTLPPADGQDDAALGDTPAATPAADIRLASSRPRARPAGVISLGEAAQGQTAAASIAAVAGNGPVSPLALAISARPAPRPGNFSKAVEAAVAAAVREAPPEPVAEAAPAPEPEPAQQATLRVRKPTPADEPTIAAAPEADAEPEADESGVQVASSGTVAKRATFANAINLSKVNLIGVYGTSNARYALIRQSNGRYKKVQVGDRFDGGTVAAITASEVRYQKSGRIYALTLPTG